MTPIVTQISELHTQVRKQDFKWTREQREQYATLKEQRQAQISKWREEGRIWVGPSNVGKDKETQQEED